MLSTASSSSTLLSALQALAGGKKSASAQGVSEDGGSFGDLLATLSGIVTSADKTVDPATAGEQGLALPVAGPAIAGGKFLPGMLPNTAEGDTETDQAMPEAGETDAPATLTPEMVQLLLAGLPAAALPAANENADLPTSPAKSAQSATPASLPTPAPVGTEALAGLPQATAKQDRRAAPAEVSLTVRVDAEASAAEPVEVATTTHAKAAAAMPTRPEMPIFQQPAPQFSAASSEPATFSHQATGHVAPVHNPNAVDIGATLDRLVAAREALMPAQATLDIDHADFGEVSIRIEQSPHGHLSVELAGSDPELKRAVAAAVQPDSATAGNQDNAASRSGTQQRDSMTDRGTGAGSGGEARSQGERNAPGRRDDARQRDDMAQPNSRSGTFA